MASNRTERFFLVAAAMVLAIIGGSFAAQSAGRWNDQAAADSAADTDLPGRPVAQRHPTVISRPAGSPRVSTGKVDSQGNEITVSCASCHANLPSNSAAAASHLPKRFHQGLKFQHGNLHCVSCHNPPNYSDLRHADGRAIDFAEVQSLCSQCHSLQGVDYQHGAHGGMNGYWDLSRGERQRKGCIDCHDPHAPAFPSMVPTFKPYDRFLPRTETGSDHD